MNLDCLAQRLPDGAEQGELLDALTRLIEDADEIVVCAHTNPDGDALGSGLGLSQLIEARWPDKHVVNMLADNGIEVPRIYAFLPGADGFVHPDGYRFIPDLFICVDLPSADRLGDARGVMERAHATAVVDHHPAELPFADVQLNRTSAAAAGVLVAEYAARLGVPLTSAVATNLLCALVTDTGRFQYQNADPEAFAVASALVDAGANPADVALHVYQSFRQEYLHLQALVLGRVTTFDRGRIAYSYCQLSDLQRTGARQDECDGLVDIVRTVDGAEVCLFLKETEGGKIRGNLRSKGVHDVSGIAHAMGGGGHRAAAGFSATGSIDEVLDVVLPMLRALVDGGPADTTFMKALRV